MKIPHTNLLLIFIAILIGLGVESVAGQSSRVANSQKSKPRIIEIAAQPGTIIWIDGIRFGTTDGAGKLRITTTAGRKTIRARTNGFKETTLALPASQSGEFSITTSRQVDEAELAFQQAETLAASDREKSTELYRKAIELSPKYIDAFLGLARVQTTAGNHADAEKTLKTLRRIRPAHAEASAVEGRIYTELGEEDKAIISFKRAIREGAGFQPEAYTGLGLIYKERAEAAATDGDSDAETANYTSAEQNFATAIKQLAGAPDSIIIYQLLGLILEKQKKASEAISLYEDFLRLYPDNAEATAFESFVIQLKKQLSEQGQP